MLYVGSSREERRRSGTTSVKVQGNGRPRSQPSKAHRGMGAGQEDVGMEMCDYYPLEHLGKDQIAAALRSHFEGARPGLREAVSTVKPDRLGISSVRSEQ